MTKRVFEQVASRLRTDLGRAARQFADTGEMDAFAGISSVVYAATLFADVAGQDNARFDRRRFLDAAGLVEDERGVRPVVPVKR